MRIILGVIVAMMAALPASAQAVDGASDHPDIGRYSGSKITQFERVEYDAQRMLVDADEETYADVEGEVTRIVYDTPEGASLLQITRSFEQRLEGKDWDILVICADAACGGLGRLRATAWGPLLHCGSFPQRAVFLAIITSFRVCIGLVGWRYFADSVASQTNSQKNKQTN